MNWSLVQHSHVRGCSAHMLISTAVFGLRWHLCVCVCLCCVLYMFFLLSGAVATMELSRGEVPLYVSLREQFSFYSINLSLTPLFSVFPDVLFVSF